MVSLSLSTWIFNTFKIELDKVGNNRSRFFSKVHSNLSCRLFSYFSDYIHCGNAISNLKFIGCNIIDSIETFKLIFENIFKGICHFFNILIFFTKFGNPSWHTDYKKMSIARFKQVKLSCICEVSNSTHTCKGRCRHGFFSIFYHTVLPPSA